MLIANWVAVLFLVLIFIIGIGAVLGWMIADQRYEEAKKENKALIEENERLKSKLRLIRLYKTLEEDVK